MRTCALPPPAAAAEEGAGGGSNEAVERASKRPKKAATAAPEPSLLPSTTVVLMEGGKARHGAASLPAPVACAAGLVTRLSRAHTPPFAVVLRRFSVEDDAMAKFAKFMDGQMEQGVGGDDKPYPLGRVVSLLLHIVRVKNGDCIRTLNGAVIEIDVDPHYCLFRPNGHASSNKDILLDDTNAFRVLGGSLRRGLLVRESRTQPRVRVSPL